MWLFDLSPMVMYLLVSAVAFVLLKPLMLLNDAFKVRRNLRSNRRG